ncbi:MAG TPA: hypothetical protein DDZ96_08905 [Porphyromonadaceae bacterium]|jgi:hypothetical protein|nr:hypothetical protein [Porphyromonadaceae bacterium]HBL33917.1 hypothetical protein [Porphyromonadaceae bacterium]HBX21104.1 hypothetical protein [Porphyromonadaceae bacterium]HCM22061.1 hypothetical protein [Porphyromonadaceae bacterium]
MNPTEDSEKSFFHRKENIACCVWLQTSSTDSRIIMKGVPKRLGFTPSGFYKFTMLMKGKPPGGLVLHLCNDRGADKVSRLNTPIHFSIIEKKFIFASIN